MASYTLPVWGVSNEADKQALKEGLEAVEGIEKAFVRIFGADCERLADDPEKYPTNVSVFPNIEIRFGWLEFKAAIEQVDAGRGKFVIDKSSDPLFVSAAKAA